MYAAASRNRKPFPVSRQVRGSQAARSDSKPLVFDPKSFASDPSRSCLIPNRPRLIPLEERIREGIGTSLNGAVISGFGMQPAGSPPHVPAGADEA